MSRGPYQSPDNSCATTLVRPQLPQLADTGALVVAELTANTVNHARAEFIRVTVRRVCADRVRVAVIDKSRPVPALLEPGDDTEHGGGLASLGFVHQMPA